MTGQISTGDNTFAQSVQNHLYSEATPAVVAFTTGSQLSRTEVAAVAAVWAQAHQGEGSSKVRPGVGIRNIVAAGPTPVLSREEAHAQAVTVGRTHQIEGLDS